MRENDAFELSSIAIVACLTKPALSHLVAIGISPTSVVEIFNILMFAAFCAILWRFLDPARLLYWATVIFVFFYFPFIDAMNGMETALFLPVIAGTLLALRKGRFEAGILLTVIAAITRPKNVLLLLPVCAVALGRLSWRVSGACHGSREATMNGSSMSTTKVLTAAFSEAR